MSLFFLFRLHQINREPEKAKLAALALREHPNVLSVLDQPAYRQLLVSVAAFSPELAPITRPVRHAHSGSAKPFDAIETLVQIVRDHPSHRVVFVGFQNGDAYLCLHALGGAVSYWRPKG